MRLARRVTPIGWASLALNPVLVPPRAPRRPTPCRSSRLGSALVPGVLAGPFVAVPVGALLSVFCHRIVPPGRRSAGVPTRVLPCCPRGASALQLASSSQRCVAAARCARNFCRRRTSATERVSVVAVAGPSPTCENRPCVRCLVRPMRTRRPELAAGDVEVLDETRHVLGVKGQRPFELLEDAHEVEHEP